MAVRQNNKSMQTYCQEFQDASAELSDNVGPSNYVQCFYFLDHMERSYAERLALNPRTLGPWESFSDLLQAARHVGSVVRNELSSATHQAAKSGQKRPRDGQNVSAPSAKKGVKAAMTPDRSAAEQRYMRAKGLCFHCMVKAGQSMFQYVFRRSWVLLLSHCPQILMLLTGQKPSHQESSSVGFGRASS